MSEANQNDNQGLVQSLVSPDGVQGIKAEPQSRDVSPALANVRRFVVSGVKPRCVGNVFLKLDSRVHERLKGASRLSGVSMQSLICQMIEHCLPDVESDIARQTKSRNKE